MKVGVNLRYKFSQLVNISELKELIDSIYSITGINCLIKDIDCRSVALGKHIKVCGKLHKKSYLTKFSCYNAEQSILHQIRSGKDYAICKCDNGLIYIGTPIVISGKYIATLFTGQVFIKEPDINCVRMQAKKLKFDEEEYIRAIREIPIVSEEKIMQLINFFCKSAKFLGELGDRHLKEIEVNNKLNENYRELSKAYQQLSTLKKNVNTNMKRWKKWHIVI